jgi:hypothetical protein
MADAVGLLMTATIGMTTGFTLGMRGSASGVARDNRTDRRSRADIASVALLFGGSVGFRASNEEPLTSVL